MMMEIRDVPLSSSSGAGKANALELAHVQAMPRLWAHSSTQRPLAWCVLECVQLIAPCNVLAFFIISKWDSFEALQTHSLSHEICDDHFHYFSKDPLSKRNSKYLSISCRCIP
jgi:hypothetical protein